MANGGVLNRLHALLFVLAGCMDSCTDFMAAAARFGCVIKHHCTFCNCKSLGRINLLVKKSYYCLIMVAMVVSNML